jgi:hypothetical protein
MDYSYNEEVMDELRNQDISYAFCVEPKDIEMTSSRYKLPRYDCTLFEY